MILSKGIFGMCKNSIFITIYKIKVKELCVLQLNSYLLIIRYHILYFGKQSCKYPNLHNGIVVHSPQYSCPFFD